MMSHQRQGYGAGYYGHQEYPHDPRLLFCDLCREQYFTAPAYLVHIRTDMHKKKTQAMPQHMRSEYLKRHIQRVLSLASHSHHSRIAMELGAIRSTDRDSFYICMVCDVSILSWNNWRAHMATAIHEKKMRNCENLMYIEKLENIIIESDGNGDYFEGEDLYCMGNGSAFQNRMGPGAARQGKKVPPLMMQTVGGYPKRDTVNYNDYDAYGVGGGYGEEDMRVNSRYPGGWGTSQAHLQPTNKPCDAVNQRRPQYAEDYETMLAMFGNMNAVGSDMSQRSQILAGIMAGNKKALSKVEKWVLEAAIENDRGMLMRADSDLVLAIGEVRRQVLIEALKDRNAAEKKQLVLRDIMAGKGKALQHVQPWLLIAVLQGNRQTIAEGDPDLVKALLKVPKQFIKATLQKNPDVERRRLISCIRAGSRAALMEVERRVLKAVAYDDSFIKSQADPDMIHALETLDKEMIFSALRKHKERQRQADAAAEQKLAKGQQGSAKANDAKKAPAKTDKVPSQKSIEAKKKQETVVQKKNNLEEKANKEANKGKGSVNGKADNGHGDEKNTGADNDKPEIKGESKE